MLQLTFALTGIMALILAIGAALDFDPPTRTVSALASSFMWVIWAFGAFEIRVGETGEAYTHAFLGYFGYGVAFLMFALFVSNFYDMIKERA